MSPTLENLHTHIEAADSRYPNIQHLKNELQLEKERSMLEWEKLERERIRINSVLKFIIPIAIILSLVSIVANSILLFAGRS